MPPKVRVAMVSPMPPARTGIASYTRAVVEGLRGLGHVRDLDVLSPSGHSHDVAVARYAIPVYHVGNNAEFHSDIYRLAVAHPGIVVLHDLGLDDLVRALVARADPLGYRAWREAARRELLLSLPEARLHRPLATPWCAHIVRHALGVIVHSEFCRIYLEDFGCRTPVYVVPHPPVEREDDLRRAELLAARLRARARLGADDLLIVAPGDLNQAKQLDAVLVAVRGLERGKVALVGRSIPGYDVAATVARSGLGDRAIVAPDVSDAEFRAWLLAADVVVDLRYPHRGEVSGSLIRSMQVGRATIVSGTGTYLDVPEGTVVRISPGPADSRELEAVFRGPMSDAGLRADIGRRAREHVTRAASVEATALGYQRAIDATVRLSRDPRRLAVARWSRALNDLGIGARHLDEGFGLDYVRGLVELGVHVRPSE